MNRTKFNGSIWLGSLSSDPSTLVDGMMWYNSTDLVFRGRINGVTEDFATPTSGQPSYAFLRDEKTSGTDGGTFTSGSYQTRTLNTEIDPDGIVTLSSNQFTLGAGTYYIKARAPACSVNTLGIAMHKAKLRNITDSTDDLIGSNANIKFDSASGSQGATDSTIEGIITIAGNKTFEIQHRCTETENTLGFGRACSFGDTEVYTTVTIMKLP